MKHYEPVKFIINALGLAEVIIDVVVQHHGFLDSNISDQRAIFTSKFWSSLCYFFNIKPQLSIAFYL